MERINTPCPDYKQAHLCDKCGNYTYIVSQTLRYCDHCNTTIPLTPEDHQYAIQRGYPKDFNIDEFRRMRLIQRMEDIVQEIHGFRCKRWYTQ